VALSNPGDQENDFDSTVAGDVSLVNVDKKHRTPWLEQVRGPGAPREFSLGPGETIVGRGNQATLCIDSALLSRRHAAIRSAGPEHRLHDLDSANGVYVNGVKAHSAILHDGDTVQIGDVVLVFHEAGR
jgi:predicted component of type VI protein secretion system